MGSGGPDWRDLDGSLPSPAEAALGLYLHYRDELKHDHATAYAAALAQLRELFKEMNDLQARAICREAIKPELEALHRKFLGEAY